MFVVTQILALFTAWSLDKEKNATKSPIIFELIPHSSLKSFNWASVIFLMMFKDSVITKFTLGQSQASYIICLGLASYYEGELAKSLTPLSETALVHVLTKLLIPSAILSSFIYIWSVLMN